MPIRLAVDNRHVTISGATRRQIRSLEKATSYLVAGFMYSPAFRAKKWDGREHLLKFSAKRGYRAPAGLLGDICAALDDEGVRYELDFSKRKRNTALVTYHWSPGIELRPYQKEAINSICDASRWDNGSGLLKMAIRSGKTKTAAGIIHRLQARTLFIVPSQMLLHQTCASLEESLPGAQITKIGDGKWDAEGDVVVATIQSLTNRAGGWIVEKDGPKKKKRRKKPTPEYLELCKAFDLVIFDEAHHLRGDSWHGVVMELDAPYKVGLSATIYLDHEREVERGAIWLKACCGDIKYTIESSELIRMGYLMRQNVELVPISEPGDLADRRWSKTLQDEAIYMNGYRNAVCALKAKEKVDQGMKALVISRRHAQVEQLCRMIDGLGLTVEPVTGKESAQRREELVDGFVSGYTQVLVGTVFGEGIDIPAVEAVINAEGGRDVKSTVQRQRNMTKADGKTNCVFVDMIDTTNHYFATHSAERLDAYRSEEEYEIAVTRLTPEMDTAARALAEEHAL